MCPLTGGAFAAPLAGSPTYLCKHYINALKFAVPTPRAAGCAG
jgi:hypothetical protein